MLSAEDTIIRLALAAFLGGLVGLERERLEWAAGLRTHMLVSVGSSLIMMVSAFGFADILSEGSPYILLDPSRIASQVISGIGFLCAGTILFYRQEVIRGLTTAASLWTVAGIGLATGGGLYLAAISTTILVVIILALIKPMERQIFNRHTYRQLEVNVNLKVIPLLDLQTTIENEGVFIHKIILSKTSSTKSVVTFHFLKTVNNEVMNNTIQKLQDIEGVISVTSKK